MRRKIKTRGRGRAIVTGAAGAARGTVPLLEAVWGWLNASEYRQPRGGDKSPEGGWAYADKVSFRRWTGLVAAIIGLPIGFGLYAVPLLNAMPMYWAWAPLAPPAIIMAIGIAISQGGKGLGTLLIAAAVVAAMVRVGGFMEDATEDPEGAGRAVAQGAVGVVKGLGQGVRGAIDEAGISLPDLPTLPTVDTDGDGTLSPDELNVAGEKVGETVVAVAKGTFAFAGGATGLNRLGTNDVIEARGPAGLPQWDGPDGVLAAIRDSFRWDAANCRVVIHQHNNTWRADARCQGDPPKKVAQYRSAVAAGCDFTLGEVHAYGFPGDPMMCIRY